MILLKYVLLAALVITAPVHSMGVFAAARARIGASLTELAEVGAYCKFMCTRKKNKPGTYQLHPESYGRHKEEEALLKKAGIDKTIFDTNNSSRSEQDRQNMVANEFHKAIVQYKQYDTELNDHKMNRSLCTILLIMRLNESQQWPHGKSPIELATQENLDKTKLTIIWWEAMGIAGESTGLLPTFSEDTMKKFDEQRLKYYDDNKEAITQEIYNTPSMKAFSKPLASIMGDYAVEYPLMNIWPPLINHTNPDLSADVACRTLIASA